MDNDKLFQWLQDVSWDEIDNILKINSADQKPMFLVDVYDTLDFHYKCEKEPLTNHPKSGIEIATDPPTLMTLEQMEPLLKAAIIKRARRHAKKLCGDMQSMSMSVKTLPDTLQTIIRISEFEGSSELAFQIFVAVSEWLYWICWEHPHIMSSDKLIFSFDETLLAICKKMSQEHPPSTVRIGYDALSATNFGDGDESILNNVDAKSLFPRSMQYLEEQNIKNTLHMVLYKSVGSRLPIELTEMIYDLIITTRGLTPDKNVTSTWAAVGLDAFSRHACCCPQEESISNDVDDSLLLTNMMLWSISEHQYIWYHGHDNVNGFTFDEINYLRWTRCSEQPRSIINGHSDQYLYGFVQCFHTFTDGYHPGEEAPSDRSHLYSPDEDEYQFN